MEMPQFFSPGDIVERNRLFEKVVQDSSRIILSSKHAQSICSNNFPQATERTRVLSFVPALSDASFSTDTRYVRAKYGLNECFFYLPNQFWLHKNHDVVVKAIAELKAQGKDLMVVCTGATSDVRDDKHFPELLRQIAASGMRNSFLVLGMVPRQDVVALMRECRAVIQPSLYEGWSTSVEEAKAFEVPIILSDIPVHREQAPAKCDYFPPLDFRSLATLLKDYSEVSSEPAARLEQALETHLKSFEKFGYQFKGVVSELIFNMAMY
jgi:glycosyltransferase involved in cell wall biosynthesis